MYLVVCSVPNEREDRLKRVDTQREAVEHIRQLKEYIRIRYNQKVRAEVYELPEPVEVFE